MASAQRKAVRQLLQQAEALGCTTSITKGGHWKIVCPNGGIVFCAHSPSDPRSLKNTRSHLRKNGVPL